MNELGTDWRCTRVESSPSSLFFFSGPGPETRNTFTWVALKRNKNENTNQRFLDESERDYQVWNRCWEFQSRTQHGRPRKRERGGGRERDVIHFANRSRLCFFVNWFVKVPSGNRLFLLWDDVVVLFSSFFFVLSVSVFVFGHRQRWNFPFSAYPELGVTGNYENKTMGWKANKSASVECSNLLIKTNGLDNSCH